MSPMGTNPSLLDQTGLTKIGLHWSDGRIHVYPQRNERYTDACTMERDQFGGGGFVMVWGGVSQHHRTQLVVNAGNLNALHYSLPCNAER